ncbi:MAG: hypothetical protein KKI08_17875, partial [Armatimonadetes bacterium]|nr:hypothetical protein [Armatimonadota bacterium]
RIPRGAAAATCCFLLALLHSSGCATAPKPPVLAAQRPPVLTSQQRALNLESFDAAWSIVNDKYWDPQFGGVDWQAVRDELRPRMEQATTMDQARSVLWDMVERLGRSHFLVIPAEVYQDLGESPEGSLPDGETGIDVRVIAGHALVTSLASGSPAEQAGVRPGWEIVGIDDIDVAARLAKLDEELEDRPNKCARVSYGVMGRLLGPIGTVVEVTFLDERDRRVPFTFTLSEARGHQSSFGRLGQTHVWIETKTIEGNIGYIAFNQFMDPPYLMQKFNEALPSFMDADGLILDLRGNPGGLGAMALGMAGWLVAEEQTFGRMRLRDNELKLVVRPRPTVYTGPVAVLVDGLSGSASEFLAAGLQRTGRACVVGTRTKGEVLPGNITTLPNGDVFIHATADFVFADGQALEGVGVTPDIEVPVTRETLLQGQDAVVEAAIAWLHSQHQKAGAARDHRLQIP